MMERMLNPLSLVILPMLMASPMDPNVACPVMLLSGSGEPNSISVTFRTMGRLPIRQLEFTCRKVDAKTGKAHAAQCYESNASFVPRSVYTVSYGIPGDAPGTVLVGVKSVMFSDGHTWKPTKREPCRPLKIKMPRAK